MSEYIVSTDELMDFACHFLIEGEKGIEYSDAELVEAIRGARFERLTRCESCVHSEEAGVWLRCECYGQDGTHFPDFYCSFGEPKEAGQ